MKNLSLFIALSTAFVMVACVPAPATIPGPDIPSIPSPIPSVPAPAPSDNGPSGSGTPGPTLPNDGMPEPIPNPIPSIPGSGSSGSTVSLPGGEESDQQSGEPVSRGDANSGQVVLEEEDGEGQENNEGAGGEGQDSDSIDVSLDNAVPEEETEPTFDEPTFEESSTSEASAQGGLSQATLEELERVLDQELGTFDSSVQREQRNAEEQSSQPSGAGSGSAPVIVFEDYPEQQSGGGSSGGGSGSGGSGGGGSSDGNVSVAVEDARIPPPNPDDDIVARQLREAAIAETDPELKERLWEEYYRYTGSQ